MPLTFDRVQAGEYQINDGPKMIGYIRKQNASKWLMYKGTNPSLLGSPISVKKTLKELKVEANNTFESTYVKPKPKLETLIQDVNEVNTEKMKLMGEMLKRNYVININEYVQTENGLEAVSSELGEVSIDEEVPVG